MEKFGLKGLVINGDTIQEVQTRGEDIWEKAQMEPNIVFLAPEQLISKGFDNLSKDDSPFTAQICVIAIDEAHLLKTWGSSWRKAFQQIGWVWTQFSDVVLIALTATMCRGKHIEVRLAQTGLISLKGIATECIRGEFSSRHPSGQQNHASRMSTGIICISTKKLRLGDTTCRVWRSFEVQPFSIALLTFIVAYFKSLLKL